MSASDQRLTRNARRSFALFAFIAAAAASALVMSACPIPFDLEELSVLQDQTAPGITFTAPTTGSAFQSTVTITGTIVDYDGKGAARSGDASAYIEYAGYSVLGEESAATDLSVAEDGDFSFSLATADYENQITVVVTATDKNGNTGSASITLVPDSDGPFLAVTSPEDYGEYATVITLSGFASNSAADTAITEVSPTVTYKMPGTNISGNLTLDAAGEFSATIDVSSLSGDHTIEATASDLNGNTTTVIITIVKPDIGGDISGFTVTPGNKSVTITWNAVPFAESYTISESRYGKTRTGVTSPCTWDGLDNGSLYAFQLTAVLPESAGSDAVSAEILAVPLSPLTLSPWVKGLGYESVTIEWRDYQEMSEYTVERSLSPDGPWAVRRKLTDNRFTDTEVSTGTTYYYRVSPTSYREIISNSLDAAPGRFCGEYRIIADEATSGSAQAIALSGNHLYVAAGANLDIIDISDPGNPVNLGSVPLSGTANDVVVSDDYAYVAVGTSGIAIIDVSDTSNLAGVTPVYKTTNSSAQGIALSGQYVYVADSGSGLTVIDIVDPANPAPQTTMYNEDTSGTAYDVTVSGSYAYIADYTSGLAVIGISDPTNPDAPVYKTITIGSTQNARGIAVNGTYAYIAASGYLAIVDIATPTSPGSIFSAAVDGTARGVALDGNFAFVSCTSSGMAVVDVSSPAAPAVLAQTDTPGYAYGTAVSGSYAYVADFTYGVETMEIEKPETDNAAVYTALPDVTEASGTEYGQGICTAGNHVFVAFIAGAGDRGGLAAFDVSDSSAPVSLDYAYMTSPAYAVVVSGDYAYVADYNNGLAVIDVSNPSDLKTPVYANTDGNSYDIDIAGDYAYIADAAGGLAIIDISDPANPSAPWYVSTSANSGSARGVAISNNHAFVADLSAGLAVIDISDPTDPGRAVYVDTMGSASDIVINGDYAFIADGSTGLAVIDISDPENPGTPVYRDTAGNATNVYVSGDYAYLGCSDDTVAVIDISDPEKPWPPVYISVTTTPKGIVVSDAYAYAAVGATGLASVTLEGGD